ncbi:MAG: hypothetical protein OEM38_09290 [Gammaproteobacteria bacterium]|nr:hypothetical protein [Gammaproteobacteria bacterium]
MTNPLEQQILNTDAFAAIFEDVNSEDKCKECGNNNLDQELKIEGIPHCLGCMEYGDKRILQKETST